MKTLILDYSKWRCGMNARIPENKLGKGATVLLNNRGYMCCLGQFAPQLKKGITNTDLTNASVPSELKNHNGTDCIIPYLSYNAHHQHGVVCSAFSNAAICINDNENTSVKEKIKLLRNLMKDVGLKLRVINKPKIKKQK